MRTNARWLSLALFLASSLILFRARPVAADPPPWAPAHGYRHHHDHDDDDDDDWWKGHDRDEWKKHHYKHKHDREDDSRCDQIRDRIRFNKSKIREIEPTGRHRKALQWYKDDTGNAYNDLDRCRHGG